MTEPTLFSEAKTPDAAAAAGSRAAGVTGATAPPSQQDEPAPPTVARAGSQACRESSPGPGPGRREAPQSSAISPTAATGCAEPTTEREQGRKAAPESPTISPAGTAGVGEPGRGESSSDHLLGLLDALVGGLRGLGGVRVEECLRLVGRCEARLAAVRAEKVDELARWQGEAHAADVLRGDLKQSRGAAKREVAFAERLADLPGTAEALADGAITPQAARAIADASAHTPIDEAALLIAAEAEPADVFGRTVRDHVNERTAAEDLEEQRRRQRARREANIKQESDGMYKLFGTFDPVAGARIETALAAMAKQLWHAEDPKNRATSAQRYADALEALITRQGAGASVAKAQRTTLVVVADYDFVADQLADARLIDGTPLAPSELLKVALEADILPALFDTKGQPLWLGRKTRTASVAQRVALAVRDRGCVICGAANSYCQAHHVIHWEDGGPTDIDNLCLLCSDCHHKQIHKLGADLTRHPDGTYSLKHPPNLASLASHNGKTRNGKARTSKAHAGKHGPPGHRNGTTTTNETNQPLQC